MKMIVALCVILIPWLPVFAAEEDDQAAVAAIVPGRIINRSWGWVISTPRGTTSVIRRSDGYAVTTPTETFHLIRTSDGFSISKAKKGVRELSPDDVADFLSQKHRKRR